MWQYVQNQIPPDGVIVWIRINRWSGAPFQAKFLMDAQQFINMGTEMKYPIFIVSVWKPV